MTTASRTAAAVSNSRATEVCGDHRSSLRTTARVMQKARGLFPVKTAAHLSEITRFSLRSCEAWMAGDTKMPADALTALLHSDWGLDFLVCVMAQNRTRWWTWLLRAGAAATVIRRRAADRRLLESVLNADRDLADALARTEVALSFQDQDATRPLLDALGAMGGVPGRSLAGRAI